MTAHSPRKCKIKHEQRKLGKLFMLEAGIISYLDKIRIHTRTENCFDKYSNAVQISQRVLVFHLMVLYS